jgi:hypothetical protein
VTLKGIEIPSRLDRHAAGRILENVRGTDDVSQRLDLISSEFLGCDYEEGSLGGGPALKEEFRIDLAVFDCVTFIEVVLALALARTVEDFIDKTRRIRYDRGRIDWFHRNHYMIDWARNNEQSGFVRNVTSGHSTAEKTCTLSLIEGLESRIARFRYFPLEGLPACTEAMAEGDIILFVSTREDLDVFHTGFVFKTGSRLVLRHATRRAGSVIDQGLEEFVNQNQLFGIVLLRPLCLH